MSLTFKYNI